MTWGALLPLGVRVSREVPVFAHLLGSRREVGLSSCPLGSGSCAAQGCAQVEFNKTLIPKGDCLCPRIRYDWAQMPAEEGRAVRFSFTTPFIVPMSLKCLLEFSLGGASQQNRQKLMLRKFHLNRREELCCASDHTLEQNAQRGYGVSFTGGIMELSAVQSHGLQNCPA